MSPTYNIGRRRVRCRPTDRATLISHLDQKCFPGEPMAQSVLVGSQWWLVFVEQELAGYAGAQPCDSGASVFLSRAGILPRFRGQHLQRVLIRARVRWAKRIGAKTVITYTAAHSVASANNLIAQGFVMYEAAWNWAGVEFLYWLKDMRKPRKHQ